MQTTEAWKGRRAEAKYCSASTELHCQNYSKDALQEGIQIFSNQLNRIQSRTAFVMHPKRKGRKGKCELGYDN